jgi:hypothetical protein
MGGRLAVGHKTLDLVTEVRILAPQPTFPMTFAWFSINKILTPFPST